MDTQLTPIEQWTALDTQWQEAKGRAIDAQLNLDHKMVVYLTSEGAAPSPTTEEQAAINQLWEAEEASRDALDAFISLRLDK